MRPAGSQYGSDGLAPQPAPFDAILFDFGGVLADSPFEAFESYERDNGLSPGFIRELNAANHHDNAWARLERSEVTFEEFALQFEAEARAAGGAVDARDLFARFTGTIRPEMIRAVGLCKRHFKVGLLTNNFVTPQWEDGERGTAVAAVLNLFDAVIESSVVGIRKPDPRFYELACTALGVQPQRSVFLDDLGVNLKPAKALGMTTIKVVDPTQALDELEEVVGIRLR